MMFEITFGYAHDSILAFVLLNRKDYVTVNYLFVGKTIVAQNQKWKRKSSSMLMISLCFL